MSFWKNLIAKFQSSSSDQAVDWEALLMEADLGLALTQRCVDELERQKLLKKPTEARAWLRQELLRLLSTPPPLPVTDQPEVILLVGVNGSGKTTTAAKLAQRARQEGRTVMLGAADTFRAAAVNQLQAWGERLQVPVISAPEGTDPASVAYQAHGQAIKNHSQVLIVDSAGRMPNKHNLMQEIAKVRRALGKQAAASPHHVWLVADAHTGGNVLIQAKEFHAAVGLTGLIMSKLDGSAQGGMVAAVREEIGVPTVFLGRGEQAGHLEPFSAVRFVNEFFGD